MASEFRTTEPVKDRMSHLCRASSIFQTAVSPIPTLQPRARSRHFCFYERCWCNRNWKLAEKKKKTGKSPFFFHEAKYLPLFSQFIYYMQFRSWTGLKHEPLNNLHKKKKRKDVVTKIGVCYPLILFLLSIIRLSTQSDSDYTSDVACTLSESTSIFAVP